MPLVNLFAAIVLKKKKVEQNDVLEVHLLLLFSKLEAEY